MMNQREVMLFQRIQIQFPTLILKGSQQPVLPASEDPIVSAGVHKYMAYTHIPINKRKILIKLPEEKR